jgi:hypothetical protein
VLPFAGALAVAEGLLSCSRLALRLGDIILYSAVLRPLAFFAGQQALVFLAERSTDQARASTAYIP